MSAPLFLVDDLPASARYTLAGREGHHAADVQRLKPGEIVVLADGRGGSVRAEVTAVGRGSVDVAVGQMRAFEFRATEGDWALHCHKSHHTMNAMGHDVPTMIGVDHRGVAEMISKLVPDYMVMGERGMADMGAMEMPLPDNTLPMMSGGGQFGPIEIGGMFTVLKVRRDKKSGDYADPGWFKHPTGTVAWEWRGDLPEPPRASAPQADSSTLRIQKPNSPKH